MKITARPLHDGRISPLLYGGFVELLDDLVPGMWAEMLNDRSFEGILPAVYWCYSTGAPNVCDRPWQRSDTWRLDDGQRVDGARSARLEARPGRPALLAQAGLSVTKGATYDFAGFLRADSPTLKCRVALVTLHPDGSRITLGETDLGGPTSAWTKHRCRIVSSGTSDRAAFELSAEGTGSVWADKLSLMPVDNLKGWRRDVVQAVRDARPGVVRWGGSVIDPGGYRWKTGIGCRDQRSPFPNRPWGRMDSNDVGIDEFLEFCGLVDAQPLVCVSFSDGPRSARDLVAYCNAPTDTAWGERRAANGHPEPYRVGHWQVGNELGDAEYVRGCAAIARAIKESDPDAIVLSSYPSSELLAEAGRYLDIVCPHHYDPDLAAHEASIDAAVRMARSASLGREVKVGVTEWNITGGWWGSGRVKLLTLETALYAARYLNLLHRRSDSVVLACRSNMTNSHGSGMIQTYPAGMFLTPSYHVMKLYATHSRPVPLALDGAPSGVDVSVCASDGGTRITVFAVNTTGEPVELPLDLSELGAVVVGGEVVRDALDRRQPEVQNHAAAPDRVTTEALPVGRGPVILSAYSASAVECTAD